MGASLTIPPPKHAGGAMFYPITSRAVRRRKDELGTFDRIDTAAALGRPGAFRLVTSISPKNKAV